MEKEPNTKKPVIHEISSLFDRTLHQHITRLLGAKHGIGSIPINLSTISCIILLAERENEINNLPSGEFKRCTMESIVKELSGINIDSRDNLKKVLDDMVQKGYFKVEKDGCFFAMKPATSMARLLDRIFPKMPGMNLVAYFTQMIEETRSGRKDPDSAVSQFDQILHMHGKPISGQKPELSPEMVSKTRIIKRAAQESPVSPEYKSGLISSSEKLKYVEIKELFTKTEEKEAASSDGSKDEAPWKTDETGQAEAEQPTAPSDSMEPLQDTTPEADQEKMQAPPEEAVYEEYTDKTPLSPESPDPPTELIEEVAGQPIVEEEITEEPEIVHTQDTVPKPVEKGQEEKSDESVDQLISDFEQSLEMLCPWCGTGKIEEEKTIKNKMFYRCTNSKCNFISWGKPFHISCPQCKNPFLIQVEDSEGKPILKCPRATCGYRQGSPGESPAPVSQVPISPAVGASPTIPSPKKPSKRVVRKRLVRRKRK